MYSDTFNISHIISQFIRYSLESGYKIWQELLLNCLNKWILIISDNFDRKVCNGWLNQKFSQLLLWQYLHNYQ